MGRRNSDMGQPGNDDRERSHTEAWKAGNVSRDSLAQGIGGYTDLPGSQDDPYVQDWEFAAQSAGVLLLTGAGADNVYHSTKNGQRRTLLEHLVGTYKLLKENLYPEYVCLAGLCTAFMVRTSSDISCYKALTPLLERRFVL